MMHRAERWYRFLIGLLPGSLRQGFEEEMTRDFLRRLEGTQGPFEKIALWGGAVLDLLVQGILERLRPPARRCSGRWAGRAGSPLDAWGKDLHYAARTLRRNPSFTVMAAFTLALGIGGATVVFSLVKGVLLRPLPFPSDQNLVVLREQGLDGQAQSLSFPNFDDFRSQSRSFEGIAALRFAAEASILGGEEPARGVIVPVSREFFSVLGVLPCLGRPLLPEENRPGGDDAAVVAYEFWTRFLGSEERLERLQINVSGTRYAVVGVMPPGFKVLEDAAVYLPLEQNAFMVRSSSNYRAIGRLAEGATLSQAQAELAGIVDRIRETYPEEARLEGVIMRPLREEVLGGLTRPLYLLLGASGLLLLLACSNVASTLMARSVRRRREMSIRIAVGGGRARLVRLVFTESLFLAALSGLGGVGMTLVTLKILKTAGAGFIPRLAIVSADGTVLAFALGATLLTSLLFGLLPAFRLPAPASTLRSGSWGNASGKSRLGWNLLVGGQVALAVSLVVASGLLLRSMREILSADTHFRSEGVLTVALDFSAAGFESQAERGTKLVEWKAELGSLPGVRAVGWVNYLPDARRMMTGAVFRPPWPVDGWPELLARDVGWRIVDEDYFRTMGIPLLEGRFFTSADGPESHPVIILNESLARVLFPDRKAVGSVVQFDPFWQKTDLEVVGVVAEARDWRVPAGEQFEGFIFWPQRLSYTRQLTAVLHTRGDPEGLIGPARQRLLAVAPNVPGTFRTLESLLADSYRDRSFTLGVLGVFALLSLFLSAVGIHGVVSYTVSAQTREIGIMLALGAQRGEVRARIFLRSARAVVAGTLVGIGLALTTGGVLQSLLYQVEPRDPVTLVLAPLVLLISASLAILLPVVRYTRVDPVSAMRMD
jgi:putative ABC transport system permease protein